MKTHRRDKGSWKVNKKEEAYQERVEKNKERERYMCVCAYVHIPEREQKDREYVYFAKDL